MGKDRLGWSLQAYCAEVNLQKCRSLRRGSRTRIRAEFPRRLYCSTSAGTGGEVGDGHVTGSRISATRPPASRPTSDGHF